MSLYPNTPCVCSWYRVGRETCRGVFDQRSHGQLANAGHCLEVGNRAGDIAGEGQEDTGAQIGRDPCGNGTSGAEHGERCSGDGEIPVAGEKLARGGAIGRQGQLETEARAPAEREYRGGMQPLMYGKHDDVGHDIRQKQRRTAQNRRAVAEQRPAPMDHARRDVEARIADARTDEKPEALRGKSWKGVFRQQIERVYHAQSFPPLKSICDDGTPPAREEPRDEAERWECWSAGSVNRWHRWR